MSKYYFFPPPKLVTSGFAEQFTKTVNRSIDLKGKALSDSFDNWKLLSPKEAHRLYYGKVYRVANSGPNQLILRVRGRGGDAYQYIKCRYELNTLIAEIKTPNAVAWAHIILPGTLVLILGIISWPTSINEVLGIMLFCILAALAGLFLLNESAKSVRDDFLIQLEVERKNK